MFLKTALLYRCHGHLCSRERRTKYGSRKVEHSACSLRMNTVFGVSWNEYLCCVFTIYFSECFGELESEMSSGQTLIGRQDWTE